MDSRSGDRPHWLFSSSLLFSRSALVEKVRAPELDLLSTRAGVAGTVGFLFTCVPVRRSEWAAV
jgi:hypothetical protein